MSEKLHSQLSWLSVFLAACLILLAGCLLFFRYPAMLSATDNAMNKVPQDFQVYLKARDSLKTAQSPYNPDIHLTYKYSPGLLVVIDLLPENPRLAWIVFSGLTILVWMLFLALGTDYNFPSNVAALGLGLLISWKGSLETFDFGQFEFWLLSFSIASAMALKRAPAVSGILMGTLPWIKLPWVILSFPFVVYFSSQRFSKLSQFVGGYFFTCFIWGAALPSLTWGPERALIISHDWVQMLRTQPMHLFTTGFNQSLMSSMERWFPSLPHGLSLGISLLVLGVIFGRCVAVWIDDQEEVSPLAWISPWLMLSMLANPLSWRWSSALLVGAPMASFSRGGGLLKKVIWLLIAVCLVLQMNPIVAKLGFTHWSELHEYGVITVFWLLLMLSTLFGPAKKA